MNFSLQCLVLFLLPHWKLGTCLTPYLVFDIWHLYLPRWQVSLTIITYVWVGLLCTADSNVFHCFVLNRREDYWSFWLIFHSPFSGVFVNSVEDSSMLVFHLSYNINMSFTYLKQMIICLKGDVEMRILNMRMYSANGCFNTN
jgi:hypothetical protein